MTQTIRFAPSDAFYRELKSRVYQHLAESHRAPQGGWRLMSKALLILSLYLGSYLALNLYATSTWSIMLCMFLIAQSIVMIGFNVMHDAGHGSFSSHRWINILMSYTLDLVGASQWLWQTKHGVLHHTYTNVSSHDDDLTTNDLLRLHHEQDWRPVHRYQWIYAPLLYSLLTVHWVFSDFRDFFMRKIGPHSLKAPSKRAVTCFVGFKLLFFSMAFAIPMLRFAWWQVLLGWVAIEMLVGLTLATTFQLAHVVTDVMQPDLPAEGERLPDTWAAHQVKTTANFATHNPLLSWYVGGLNFQIEHHLFTKISHVHYPFIAPIVEKMCRDHQLPYQSYPTLGSALRAHFAKLRSLGAH